MIITIIVCIFMAAAVFLLGCAILDDNISSKVRVLRPTNSEEVFEHEPFTKTKILIMSLIVAAACAAASALVLNYTDGAINAAKLCMSIVCVAGSSFSDYKEHRIPNIFPLTMALINIAMLAIGFFTDQQWIMSYVAGTVISVVAVTLLLTISSFLTRGGVGMGDIKLLAALSFIGDVYLICAVLFFSFLLCALTGLGLIILKKKSSKEGLPFAPFVLAGLLISIYLNIF